MAIAELGIGQSRQVEDLSELSPLVRNPLLHPLDFESERAMQAFRAVTNKKIAELGGVPAEIEPVLIQDPYHRDKHLPRLVVKFRPPIISLHQVEQLEEVARRMYSLKVRSTKNADGSVSASVTYPKLDSGGSKRDDSTIGWYFGPETNVPERTASGLFVMRHVSRRDVASGVKARRDLSWFVQDELQDNSGRKVKSDYLVEIREEDMYQTDLAEAIVLTSLVLAGKEIPSDKPGLLYEIYYDMNQIGLKENTRLPGLEPMIEEVEEAQVLPLASPDMAQGITAAPRSVVLVGQVGTGKTQIIKDLIKRPLGVVMVNIDSESFGEDLKAALGARKILPRVRDVAQRTGRSMILVLEDMEKLAHKDNPISATLLNELAGLYRSGFSILATTNHPEEFNPQLLESERLGGRLIHCPLPNLEARRLILDIHTPLQSREMEIDLFDPVSIGREIGIEFDTPGSARDFILDGLALCTNGFTPRYLQDLTDRAKKAFEYRIAREVGRLDNLSEVDLVGQSFSIEDWRKALRGVLDVYNWLERLEEDKRLLKLVKPGREIKEPPGFRTNGHSEEDLAPYIAFEKTIAEARDRYRFQRIGNPIV